MNVNTVNDTTAHLSATHQSALETTPFPEQHKKCKRVAGVPKGDSTHWANTVQFNTQQKKYVPPLEQYPSVCDLMAGFLG